LISVADTLGVGEEGRAALIEFCADLPGADVGVQALKDIAQVFKSRAEHLFTLSDWTRRSGPPRKEPELPIFACRHSFAVPLQKGVDSGAA
jgi:hypothetical protein